ncbi:1-deoxy-D-xylulose 5-phosphate reductoisomerase [Babesia gibsoni]|uniref:1-deoxy-D-xylulose 5-phosphate reductoisomerase, apicoplastic n=1 Tax=Babesia gibsoni TaxID=33632 RepID=A0AAD8PEQ6_BABGI|nr:1-deoxy-D-xylulose 5-phosphate reductoisomerase [Babesia gibsoni]
MMVYISMNAVLAVMSVLPSMAFHVTHKQGKLRFCSLRAEPIRVAIYGSTGSIGTQTLDTIRSTNKASAVPRFKVVALTANSNAEDLAKQAEEFKPNNLNINFNADDLRSRLSSDFHITTGAEGLKELCNIVDYDILVMGISGCAGIEPTVAAAKRGKKLALANKESVVSAGNLLRRVIRESKCDIIPVDSEHNALYQCLMTSARDYISHVNERSEDALCSLSPNVTKSIKQLIITSSGGPFRDTPLSMMKDLRVKDALTHPVWDMGAKITIDSSTMMNKGLEVIEAHHLFGIPYERIKVLIHKECIVHSMVEFVDNSIIAQLYKPDMRLPIAYSLNWPDRSENTLPELNLTEKPLTFSDPDLNKFPCLKLAFEVGKMGGLYPTVMNAANEQANEILRQDAIKHCELYDLVHDAIENFKPPYTSEYTIEEIMEAHEWGKQHVLHESKKRP